MAWTSLESRISGLPLVLAGPIVRKTTRTSVSIWIALKESATLELVIKSNPDLRNIASSTASTKSFGRHLHIAVITVSGLNLEPNRIYHYDINFPGSKTLVSQGILESAGGVSKLVYGGHMLPSFMLPSDNMHNLRIIHASCRKPHGGENGDMNKDAFEAVHNILNRTHHLPNERPQQLYLTGDQIYADDVSDLLLFMLRDAENILLGWSTREQLPSAPNHITLSPLHRLPLIRTAGFTCGDVGKSHLLRLGEYYSMYLFAWSEVLWPTNSNFPSYDRDYSSYAADEDAYNISGELTQRKYEEKKQKLIDFRNSIPYVRKLLANISTYMIFDDHEITDDWFLNRTWVDNVYTSRDGKRIIQNGLSAYAVFQGWGNKPEVFNNSSSNENRLLNALTTLNQNGISGISQDSTWSDISNIILPNLSGNNLTGGINWSYSLSFDLFNVIVLNTRTNRSLYRGFAGLLSNDAIQTQIRDRVSEKLPQHNFTLIISPAPVFGLPLMEELIQPVVSRFAGYPTGDYEPWVADRNKFEHFLKEVSAFRRVLFLSGDVHYSFSNSVDYWDKRTGTEVISKFVNLTSSSLKNSKNGLDGTTTLADLINNHIPEIILNIENDGIYTCWSNSPGSAIIRERSNKILGGLVEINVVQERVTVNRGSGSGIAHWHHLVPYSSFYPIARRPIARTRYITREWVDPDPGYTPDWQYKIVFESDYRSDIDRMSGTMPTLSVTSGSIGTGSRHGTLSTTRSNHTIVGHNNIGEIVFQWGTNEVDKKVIHKIWSRVGNDFVPFTVHLLDFGIASTTDQRPREIGRIP